MGSHIHKGHCATVVLEFSSSSSSSSDDESLSQRDHFSEDERNDGNQQADGMRSFILLCNLLQRHRNRRLWRRV